MAATDWSAKETDARTLRLAESRVSFPLLLKKWPDHLASTKEATEWPGEPMKLDRFDLTSVLSSLTSARDSENVLGPSRDFIETGKSCGAQCGSACERHKEGSE